jgi:hypothetical protein
VESYGIRQDIATPQTTRDINTLTVIRLENATTALSAGQPVDNPVIQRLLRNVTAIGVRVPGSFFHKFQLRAEL